MKVTKYHSILLSKNLIQGWKIDDEMVYYPGFSNRKLEKFMCTELSFGASHGNRQTLLLMEKEITACLEKLLKVRNNTVIIHLSAKNYISKVRSHKGYLKNEFKYLENKYMEIEVDCGEGQSVFFCMAAVTPSDVALVERFFYDSARAFIYCTSRTLENIFILNLAAKCTNQKKTVFNYYSIMEYFISNDDLILRSSGDWGDNDLGLQVFSLKTGEDIEHLMRCLKNTTGN